jgi:hypothetical protein
MSNLLNCTTMAKLKGDSLWFKTANLALLANPCTLKK